MIQKKRFPTPDLATTKKIGFGGRIPSAHFERVGFRAENKYTRNAICVLDVDPDVIDWDPKFVFSCAPKGAETNSLRLFAVESKARGSYLIDVYDSRTVSSLRAEAHNEINYRLAQLGFTELKKWDHDHFKTGNDLANAEFIRDALVCPRFRPDPSFDAAALRGIEVSGGRGTIRELRKLAGLGTRPKAVLFYLQTS